MALAAGLGLGILIILPVTVILGLYAYFQVGGRIVPGVHVGPVSVEGLTLPQAEEALNQAWNQERKILLYDGLQYRQASPAELGLSLDAAATAGQAYQVARGEGFLSGMRQILAGYTREVEIAPVVKYDPAGAQAGLQALSGQISQPPVNASFYLDGARLVAVPGKLGYTVNVSETLARLASDPHGVLVGGFLPVHLMPVAPQVNDVSAAMAEAQRLLETPVSLHAYDPVADQSLDWPVPKEAVAAWLTVREGAAGPEVALDEARLAAYLESLNAGLGERWIDAARHSGPLAEAVRKGGSYTMLLNHHPTRYVVESGDTLLKIGWKVGMPYWMILQANPGLDPDKMWAGQEITIPSKDELLPLPVVQGKRIVISISKQRMWIYENGERVEEFVISTGIDRSPTQPGIFQVRTHERNAYASVWDLHMPNFLGIYEAWPGFMNGIHGLPTLSNGRRLWANILGRPASYGCIILDLDAAEWLYEWAEEGVVVEIRG